MTYLHWAWKYLMRFCRKSTPFFTLISFTLRRYCRENSQGSKWKGLNELILFWLSFVSSHRRKVKFSLRPSSWPYMWGLSSPHTSAAGRGVAPSPSPQRSLLRWTLCESSHAVSHVPASPSLSLFCRGQRSSQELNDNQSYIINIIQIPHFAEGTDERSEDEGSFNFIMVASWQLLSVFILWLKPQYSSVWYGTGFSCISTTKRVPNNCVVSILVTLLLGYQVSQRVPRRQIYTHCSDCRTVNRTVNIYITHITGENVTM